MVAATELLARYVPTKRLSPTQKGELSQLVGHCSDAARASAARYKAMPSRRREVVRFLEALQARQLERLKAPSELPVFILWLSQQADYVEHLAESA